MPGLSLEISYIYISVRYDWYGFVEFLGNLKRESEHETGWTCISFKENRCRDSVTSVLEWAHSDEDLARYWQERGKVEKECVCLKCECVCKWKKCYWFNKESKRNSNEISDGLAVRIPGSHPGWPGSTRGEGIFFLANLLLSCRKIFFINQH
jgi:hypothetical protein